MKIGAKLMISYLFVLIVGFALSAFLAYISVNIQFTEKTKQELKISADQIANTINNSTAKELEESSYSETAIRWSYLRLVNKLSDGIVVIIGAENSILYSNDDMFYTGGQFNIENAELEYGGTTEVDWQSKSYMITKRRLKLTGLDSFNGSMYFLISMAEVNAVSNQVFVSFLPGLVISLAIALIIALLMTRSFAWPIRRLSGYASSIVPNKKTKMPVINASAEIKELANVLDGMSVRLNEFYDLQNKSLQNLSHELKSPLMSIQGYAEGIRDGVIDNEKDRDNSLKIIVDETQRLKIMVEQLILIGRMQAHEMPNLTRASLANIVEDAVSSVGGLAIKNSVTINIKKQDVFLYADIEKLEMAIINLLSNCITYAKKSVHIEVYKKQDAAYVKIYDDGDGFSNTDKEHMFERFYKGKKGGTGLGLNIAKMIAESHGGKIEANNNDDGGACFTVCLPI